MEKYMNLCGGGNPFTHNWEFLYTEVPGKFVSESFQTLEDARKFAAEIQEENEDNPDFSFIARRIVEVNSADFFNPDISADAVRAAQPNKDK